MIELQRTGFFREMPHGEPTDPSLADARNPGPVPHEDRVAAYLEAGHVHTAAAGSVRDVFDAGKSIGPPHYLTDGKFVWPGDLAHYVRTYHVRLAGPFIEHMLSNGWTVPADIDLAAFALPPRPAASAGSGTAGEPDLGAAWSEVVGAAREALNGPDGEKLRAQLAEMGSAVKRFFESFAPGGERHARFAAETEQVKTAIHQAGSEAARTAGEVGDELRGTVEQAGARLRNRLSSSLRALSDWLDKPEEERTVQVQSFMSSLRSRLDAAVARQREGQKAEGDRPAEGEGPDEGQGPSSGEQARRDPDPSDPGDRGSN